MSLSMRYQGTAITEPPTFQGAGGQKAWRVRMAPLGSRGRPDFDATVDLFIVHVPGAHAFWDHWSITVIHLRPVAGVKAPVIRREGATHELIIVTLNPEQPLPGLDATDPTWKPDFLTPIDVMEQFIAANDAIAAEILELAVKTIVDGFASPDQDWRQWWTAAIQQTAQHYRDGQYGIGRFA